MNDTREKLNDVLKKLGDEQIEKLYQKSLYLIAEELLNNFFEVEYGHTKDEERFRIVDVEKLIPVAYTRWENYYFNQLLYDDNTAYAEDYANEFDINVYVDLVDATFIYKANQFIYKIEEYGSLENMITNALEHLDYDDLVSISEEDQTTIRTLNARYGQL